MISFISRNRFINLRRRIFTTQKKSTQNINESIDNPNFKSLGLIDSLVNGLNSQSNLFYSSLLFLFQHN